MMEGVVAEAEASFPADTVVGVGMAALMMIALVEAAFVAVVQIASAVAFVAASAAAYPEMAVVAHRCASPPACPMKMVAQIAGDLAFLFASRALWAASARSWGLAGADHSARLPNGYRDYGRENLPAAHYRSVRQNFPPAYRDDSPAADRNGPAGQNGRDRLDHPIDLLEAADSVDFADFADFA